MTDLSIHGDGEVPQGKQDGQCEHGVELQKCPYHAADSSLGNPQNTATPTARTNQADNRFELVMLGGKKKAYTQILARFANGESPSHIVAVLRHEVKKLDKKLGRKQ